MSPLVLRLLLFTYTNQTLRVKWGSVMSESFTVMNGVKQGGVLSPVLFVVYTDGEKVELSVIWADTMPVLSMMFLILH